MTDHRHLGFSKFVSISGWIILFILLWVTGSFAQNRVYEFTKIASVSENIRDSLKKYSDIEQLYERYDNDNPRHNYYSKIATLYWHKVNTIDSAEAFKNIGFKYKIKFK